MYCPHCGVDMIAEAIFCHKCGFRLDEAGLEPLPEKDKPPDLPAEQPPAEQPVEPPASHPAEQPKSMLAPRGSDDDPEIDLWKGGYSGKAMLGTWFIALVVSLALLVLRIMETIAFINWPILLGLIVALWIVLWLRLVYLQLYYRFMLTTQRFTHRTGILRHTTNRIEVIDIDDVTYEQGLIERFVGTGTIWVTSSDRSHPKIDIKGIANVKQVAESMDNARRKERLKRGLHIEAI